QDFLLFQYCLSILALCYLQALICYYDQKENLHHKRHLKFLQRLSEDQTAEFGNPVPSNVVEEADSYDYSSPMSQSYAFSGERSGCASPRGYSFDGNISDHSRSLEHSSNNASMGYDHLLLDSHNPTSIPLQTSETVVNEVTPTVNADVVRVPRIQNFQAKVKFSITESSHEGPPNMNDMPVHAEFHRLEPHTEHPEAAAINAPSHVPPTSSYILTPSPSPPPSNILTTSGTDNPLIDTVPLESNHMCSDGCQTPDSIRLVNFNSPPTDCRIRRSGTVRRSTIVPFKFLFGDDPENPIHRGRYLSRDSEGVNLYLRLGAVGFGFGVMIFDGFKIAEPWEADITGAGPCHSTLWIPIHVLHFVYVFWQTYFLFKHHQVVFNVQKFALRFLLCHLAVANLCQWLKTIVDEISNEPAHESPTHVNTSDTREDRVDLLWEAFSHSITRRDGSLNVSSDEIYGTYSTERLNHTVPHTVGVEISSHFGSCRSTAKYLAPFLFPCAIEYSLIAGAIFYKMFQKVGHVREESERLARMRKANTMTRRFAECHRSHKGLFIGLLLFMATLVTMCLFFIFFTKENKKNTAITLYQSTELVLLALSLFTCVAIMIQFRVLKLSELSEEGAFDDNLLLVGLIGMIFYDLFLLVPAIEAINTGMIVARLFAAKALLEIVQSMLQVFFILEASRRCAGSLAHVRNKPGRTLITFLLILNLAMWFVNTFEVKRADNQSIHIDYYTGMAWKIITHIALPMIVFFRFHSTVCLSDIWANAYRFRTE
ncbi:Otopetrin, partial [Fasciola gigantica]